MKTTIIPNLTQNVHVGDLLTTRFGANVIVTRIKEESNMIYFDAVDGSFDACGNVWELKSTETGEFLAKTPASKMPKVKKTKRAKKVSNFDQLKKMLSKCNNSGCAFGWRKDDLYSLWMDMLVELQEIAKKENNSFAISVTEQGLNNDSISDKQAYCLAKWADKAGYKA